MSKIYLGLCKFCLPPVFLCCSLHSVSLPHPGSLLCLSLYTPLLPNSLTSMCPLGLRTSAFPSLAGSLTGRHARKANVTGIRQGGLLQVHHWEAWGEGGLTESTACLQTHLGVKQMSSWLFSFFPPSMFLPKRLALCFFFFFSKQCFFLGGLS